MRWKPSKSNYPLVIMAVFAAGLVLAGSLLYGWINRASLADREQQQDFLNAAMRSFREELRAPLQEIRATFRPIPRAGTDAALEEYLAGFYSQWQTNDANGALVSGLSVATLDVKGKAQYRTLDTRSAKFKQEPWPSSLAMFPPRLERTDVRGPGHMLMLRTGGFPFAFEGNRPVIVVPLVEADAHGRVFERQFGTFSLGRMGPPTGVFTERQEHRIRPQESGDRAATASPNLPPFPGRLRGWCFLEINVGYFEKHLLPQLLERSFSGLGLSNYQVGVLAGNPPLVVFGSEAGLTPSSFSSPDGRAVLFASYGELGALIRARTFRRSQRGGPRGSVNQSISVPPPNPPEIPVPARFGERHIPYGSAWVLVVKNKAGSIDALVARTRRRNLALGFGVLFLLALSMGSLVITTHRARELARREMEFVAGVSHEFRTPLASIQSAGFNLSSGVVKKPSRVQEYGALVQSEARRLTDMIEQVMSYAGIQSRGKRYEMAPVQVPAMVDRALAEYGSSLRDGGWEVEKDVEVNLPLVLAEASSVESAVKNLLANAIKYSGRDRWLRVTAARVPNGAREEVQVSVEDHGPGIDPADLAHIFEPFYRGKGVLASTVPGAGLGLSIVKRHIEAQGGRVSVESAKGKGTRFTLHLPAISEPERKAV
jgi:signal transduction histidine kinase